MDRKILYTAHSKKFKAHEKMKLHCTARFGIFCSSDDKNPQQLVSLCS